MTQKKKLMLTNPLTSLTHYHNRNIFLYSFSLFFCSLFKYSCWIILYFALVIEKCCNYFFSWWWYSLWIIWNYFSYHIFYKCNQRIRYYVYCNFKKLINITPVWYYHNHFRYWLQPVQTITRTNTGLASTLWKRKKYQQQ